MNEPPLLRLPYPSVAAGRRHDITATNDGSAAARALSAHLAIYARAAAQVGGRDDCPASPSASAANSCRFARTRDGVTARGRSRAAARGRSAPPIWSAATAARARCASSSASSCAAKPICWQLRQALFRCDELFDRLPIGNGPGHGRHYHVADDKATFLIMQDSTKHWTLHRDGRDRRRDEGAVREDRRRSGRLRDAVLQSVAAEPAARRQLSARAACSSPATRCISSSRPAGSA